MFRVLATLLVLALPAGDAFSGAHLGVSAVVAKSARIALGNQPESIQVTAEDIARGYVDVAPGPRLEARTNSREGLLVTFQVRPGGFARAVELRGAGGASLRLAGSARGVSVRQVELSYRLLLSPRARPGVHAWPVQLLAVPL